MPIQEIIQIFVTFKAIPGLFREYEIVFVFRYHAQVQHTVSTYHMVTHENNRKQQS